MEMNGKIEIDKDFLTKVLNQLNEQNRKLNDFIADNQKSGNFGFLTIDLPPILPPEERVRRFQAFQKELRPLMDRYQITSISAKL